jgi:CubicO group peptidase (beta-lactamase class C family)
MAKLCKSLKIMSKTYFIWILLLFTALSVQSQDVDTAKLDSYFDILENENQFMGSLALSKNGAPFYTRQLGYTDIESNKKPNVDTRYRIGSISKTFTATMIFMALEEGLINLEDPLSKYLSNIENGDKITISDLLNHRSGIFNFTSDPKYMSYNTEKKSREEMLEIISEAKSVFPPGSQAAYSNSNYVLLTYILEDLYQKSFADLLLDKIAKPLEMNHTYVGKAISLEDNETNSYVYIDNWTKQTQTDPSIPLGAGAIVSNPSDLNRFGYGLFSGALISKESLGLMTEISDGYGRGIFPIPFNERASFGHNGGIDGFSSVFGYFPDDGLGYALTSNGTLIKNNDVLILLLKAAYGLEFDLPFIPETEDLSSYLGLYSGPDFPLKIDVSLNKNSLFVQATGQGKLLLQANKRNVFSIEGLNLKITFDPDNNKMLLEQNGMTFNLSKE